MPAPSGLQLEPPPYQSASGSQRWNSWFRQVNALLYDAFSWTNFDFSGSNLTDIATRNHYDLQNLQGGDGLNPGEYYHLTANQHTNLTSGLQGAYNLDTSVPQITVANGFPLTIDLTSASNDVFALRDESDVDLVRWSDTEMSLDIPLIIGDVSDNSSVAVNYNANFSIGGAFIGGLLQNIGTLTIDNATFIWSNFLERRTYDQTVTAGFAAFTMMSGIPVLTTSTTFAPVAVIAYQSAPIFQRTAAGSGTTTFATSLIHNAQVKATVSGATQGLTNQTAVACSPTYSSVLGSTVNLGNVRGLHCTNPAPGFLQPSAGVETLTSYIGVDINAIPFGGNVTKRGFRSALTAATATLMIENTGGAASDFGAGVVHLNDNTAVQFGGAVNAADTSLFWSTASSTFHMFFFSTSDNLEFSSPAADRFLIGTNAGNTVGEINIDCLRFSLGAQSGANGNPIGIFVAGADTPAVSGGYAQFLLTQAGSYTNGGFSMSDVSAWVINSMSFAASSGSITELATLKVGGMTTSNPGVTVTERAGLWSRGRHMQQGMTQFEPRHASTLSAGNNNDWAGNLTGSPSNSSRRWVIVDGDGGGTSVITGIDATAVQDGDTIDITNDGTTFDLGHQDANSAAANRIISPTGANYTLGTDESAQLRYDSTAARWRILWGTGA